MSLLGQRSIKELSRRQTLHRVSWVGGGFPGWPGHSCTLRGWKQCNHTPAASLTWELGQFDHKSWLDKSSLLLGIMGLHVESLPVMKLNPRGDSLPREHSRPYFVELLHSQLHVFHGPTLLFLNLYFGHCLKYTSWTKAAYM